MQVKRGPKPTLNEEELIAWMDCQADASQAPTMKDIKEHAERMVKALPCGAVSRTGCKFGKKWWALFKNRHKNFIGRKPQLVESQRAIAKLTEEEWLSFFKTSLRPALSCVNFEARYIHNMDETRFFRNFETVGPAVWVRRGSKRVARKRGWARQHISALVCCFAVGTNNTPCLMWHNKKFKGEWFLKKKGGGGPVRIKGTPDGWSSAYIFVEWVKNVFVLEVPPLHKPRK